MILDDFRNADFSDLGSAPRTVRYTLLAVVLILILVAGYFLFIEDKKIQFNFHPLDIEFISFDADEVTMLRDAQVIMITSDPDNPFQSAISFLEYELESKLMLFNRVVTHGTSEDNNLSASAALQQITCDTATEKSPVIYLKKGNGTGVTTQDNCMIITVKNEYDVVKVKDALIYRILGVIA